MCLSSESLRSLQFAVTMVAPFFPTYALARFQASESLIGLAFACNPIAQVCLTPLKLESVVTLPDLWNMSPAFGCHSLAQVCIALIFHSVIELSEACDTLLSLFRRLP